MKFKPSFRISLMCVAGALNSGAALLVSAFLQSPPNIPFCFILGFCFVLALWLLRTLFLNIPMLARVAVLVIIPLLMWRFDAFQAIYDLAVRYLEWIYYYDLSQPGAERFALLLTQVLVCFASAVFSFIFVVTKPRMLITLTFYLVTVFFPYPYIDMQQYFLAVNVTVIALLMLAVLSEYTRMAVRHGTKLMALPYQVIGIPLCALIVLISMLLPWKETGNSDLLPDRLVELTQSNLQSLFVKKATLNDTGRVDLGGRIRPGDLLIFDLESDMPFYMYADCYSYYTGSSWETNSTGAFDYRPGRYSAQSDPFRWFGRYYAPISVTYQNLSTDRLLLPHHIAEPFIYGGNHRLLANDSMVFFVEPSAGDGLSYGAMADLRNISDVKTVVESMAGIELMFEDENGEVLTQEEWYKKSLSSYLALPDTVTDRTRELAEEITANAKTALDKALALQKFLSETYPYTLNAPALPKDRDFVDFFLFDAKTGYCTSYASAMTVMLRCIGIAARYCEGFAPNIGNYDNGVYRVYEADAHAWVEAYIPYVGWVEFEPTATANAAYYRSASEAPKESEPYRPDNEPTPEPTPEPEPESTPEPVLPSPSTAPIAEKQGKNDTLIRIVATVLLIVVPPLAWIYGGRAYVKLIRFTLKYKSPDAQARFWFRRMRNLLKAEGYTIQSYETLREFMERVQENLPSSGIDLFPAIALVEKTRYNGESLTNDELDAFHTAHRQLAAGLGAGWGFVKRWWETNVTWRLLW